MRVIAVVLALWLAFLVATPLHAWSTVTRVDATPAGQRPVDTAGFNYLLVGSDSLPSDGLHCFHEGDTCHPVEPSTLLVRLQTLGFGAVMVAVDEVLMFTARKPAPAGSGQAA